MPSPQARTASIALAKSLGSSLIESGYAPPHPSTVKWELYG